MHHRSPDISLVLAGFYFAFHLFSQYEAIILLGEQETHQAILHVARSVILLLVMIKARTVGASSGRFLDL